MHRSGIITSCLLICFVVLSPGQARADGPRFDHLGHEEAARKKGQDWKCSGCHADDKAANQIRPGQADHKTCDGDGCHAQEFYAADRKRRPVCTVCHFGEQIWEDLRRIKDFPSGDRQERTFCINFSHQAHLELPKLGRRACDKCHKVDGKNAAYVPPNHGDCAGCHTPTHAVPMASCGSCHNMGSADGSVTQCSPTVPWRSRQIAKRFSHDSHRTDIRKPGSPPLDCGFCHWGVHRSKSVRKMKLMHGFKTMERACGPCHNGRLRVPGSKRRVFSTTGDCRKCHGNKFSSGAGVPTGH